MRIPPPRPPMALVVEPPPASLYEMETLWSEPTSMSLDENEMEDVPHHGRPSGNAEGKRRSGDLVREFQQAVEGLLHSHAEEMRAVIVAAVSAERTLWASDGMGVPRIRQTVSQDGGPVMKMQDIHGDQEVTHAKPHHWKTARKSMSVSEDSDEDEDEKLMKNALRPRRLSLSASTLNSDTSMLHDTTTGHSRNSRAEKDASASRPMKRVSPVRLPSEMLPGQLPDEEAEARHVDSNGLDTDSQSAPEVRGSFRVSDHEDEHHSGVMRGYAATKCIDPDAMRRPGTRRSTYGITSTSQLRARALVKNVKFEYGVCMMVLLNAVVLGLQTDLVANGRVATTPVPLLALEAIMCGIFTVELLLRIFAYRSRIFTMSGWQWNIFDSIIVGVQVSEQIITFATRDDRALMNFSVARVIRSLRLIRLLRVARVLRGIGELRILVLSIMSAMQSLAWTVVLLTLMIYTLAIYLTQMVIDCQATLEPDSKWTEVLNQYYGSVPSAMLSLFMSLTGGLDWVVVCQPLMETISPVMGLLFF